MERPAPILRLQVILKISFSFHGRRLPPAGRRLGRLRVTLNSRLPLLVLAAFLPLLASSVEAAGPESTEPGARGSERPVEELFLTDTIYTQSKGEIQLGLLSGYQKWRDLEVLQLEASLEIGVTDAWQVDLEWTGYQLRRSEDSASEGGIGDVEIGTQYSFMNLGGGSFSIAPRLAIEFPLGDVDTGLSEGVIVYQPSVIVAHDLAAPRPAQLFAQLGLSIVQRVRTAADPEAEDSESNQIIANAGFFDQLTRRWIVTLELNWTTSRFGNFGEESSFYVTPGSLFNLTPGLQAGIGAPIGINSGAARYQIIGSLACDF
jgi:hypothetical protein